MLDVVQWPAMVVTVVAAWLAASRRKPRRASGFWVFLASNVLWIVWAVPARAYALIVLQIALAVMNLRGILANDGAPGDHALTTEGDELAAR
jgi:hypothetical protein